MKKYCTKFSVTDMGILLLDLNSCIKDVVRLGVSEPQLMPTPTWHV